jgi:enediyne biosynthesis protein E4
MPIVYIKNEKGKLSKNPIKIVENGFWNTLAQVDFDKDGDMDFMAGNMETNNKFGITPKTPYRLYSKDFDGNGFADPIITYCIEVKEYPAANRDELMKQLPFLRKKLIRYADYSKATLQDFFDNSQLENVLIKEIITDKSIYLENNGNGFTIKPLPDMAQMRTVRSFYVEDYDKDDNLDVILIGNSNAPKVGTGRLDASLGVILKGTGKGDFKAIHSLKSGINAQGDVRQIIKINSKKPSFIISKNNGNFIQLYQYK